MSWMEIYYMMNFIGRVIIPLSLLGIGVLYFAYLVLAGWIKSK